jgi:hypothetical protein
MKVQLSPRNQGHHTGRFLNREVKPIGLVYTPFFYALEFRLWLLTWARI